MPMIPALIKDATMAWPNALKFIALSQNSS